VPLKRSFLHEDEVVVVEVRQHWSVTFSALAAAVLIVAAVGAVGYLVAPAPLWTAWVGVAVVALPVLRAAVTVFHWSRHTVTLTSDRIVVQRGGLSLEQTQLRLERVHEVGYRQSVFDRLLGRGMVTVELEDGDVAMFPKVRRPKAFAHVVDAELNLRSGLSSTAARELADSVAELTSRRGGGVYAIERGGESSEGALDLDRAAAALPPLAQAELEALIEQFESGEISAATFERDRFELCSDYGIDPRTSR
jgi:membrane protein YdbS with pleckstrin-like domain